MTRAVAVALVIAGCLSRPSGIGGGGGDGGGDGGAGPGACNPIVIDDFGSDSASPCGSGAQMGGSATLDSGMLLLTPAVGSDGTALVGCTWSNEPTGGGGIAVETIGVLTQVPGDDTAFSITTIDGFVVSMHVFETSMGDQLMLSDSNTATIASIKSVESTQHWWRIRAFDSQTFVGEYAPDPPVAWSMLGTSTRPTSTGGPVSVSLTAVSFAQGATAYFGGVDACVAQ